MKQWVLGPDGEPKLEPDFLKWGEWFENAENRIVAQIDIGAVKVSTIFLGFDHGYSQDRNPILWETMCFGDRDYMDRCTGGREQAEAMHQKIVLQVCRDLGGLKNNEVVAALLDYPEIIAELRG